MDNKELFIRKTMQLYGDMVYRICFMYLHNKMDADDAFQEVFMKLLLKSREFENSDHEKRWIIRVSINVCKDMLKTSWFKKVEVRDDVEPVFRDPEEYQLLETVRTLPKKYKDVIYLFYYEEYSVPEMAQILDAKENTIYSRLHRAKTLLREKMKGNEDEYIF